ncbi:MAG: DUF423 domain-containing protein [Nitrospinaceae bacterium]
MNPESPDPSTPSLSPEPGRLWVILGAAFSGLSIVLGAFGAHSLKTLLTAQKMAVFHTATHYMGYHGLALILLGLLSLQLGETGARALKKAGMFFTAGILLFCGSLYILTFDGPRFFGPVTPFGGLSFMIGWFTLALAAAKQLKSKRN